MVTWKPERLFGQPLSRIRHIRAETARLCFFLPQRFWRKSSNDEELRQQPVLTGRKHRAYKEIHASLDADQHMCAVSARGVPIV